MKSLTDLIAGLSRSRESTHCIDRRQGIRDVLREHCTPPLHERDPELPQLGMHEDAVAATAGFFHEARIE
jgi:hypothetical protein